MMRVRWHWLTVLGFCITAEASPIVLTNNSANSLRIEILTTDNSESTQAIILAPYETKNISSNEIASFHLEVLDQPDVSLDISTYPNAKGVTADFKNLLFPVNRRLLEPDGAIVHYPENSSAFFSVYAHLTDDRHSNRVHFVFQFNNSFFNENENENELNAQNSDHLSILTYNVKLDPVYFKLETSLNQPYVREPEIVNLLQNPHYDVVVLQELFSAELRKRVIAALTDPARANRYAYHTLLNPHTGWGKFLSGGVMIFSRWPIIAQDQTIFSHCYGGDCFAAKGVVYAKIKKNDRIYNVFGTHLQAGSSHRNVHILGMSDAKAAKIAQLQQFAVFIRKQNLASNARVLVAGDFNLDMNDPSNRQLLAQEIQTPQEDNYMIGAYHYTCDGTTNTMSENEGKKRLDMVLPILKTEFSSGTVTYLMPQQFTNRVVVFRALENAKLWDNFDLSDHYAVEGDFLY